MEHLLDSLVEFFKLQSDLVLYGILFIGAIFENIFPPIPGETITIFGAYMIGSGSLNFVPAYLFITLGNVFGFMILFYIGRYLEREFFLQKDFKKFTASTILATEKWEDTYGYFIILANRFLPGLRTLISVASGISHLKPAMVFLIATVSAALWDFIWLLAGVELGGNWGIVKRKLIANISSYKIIAGMILFCSVAAYVGLGIRKYHRGEKK